MVTCAGFVEPLNLECLLINIFAGNATIFLFLGIIIIAAVAARLQMRDEVVIFSLGLYAFIVAQYERGFVLLFILLVGIISYAAFRRPISRS